jgi:hypothetical protein
MPSLEAYDWLYSGASDYEKAHMEHITNDEFADGCAECAAEQAADPDARS